MAYALVDGKVRVVANNGSVPRLRLATKQSKEEDQLNNLVAIAEKRGLTQYTPKPAKEGIFKRVIEGLNLVNPTGALNRYLKGEESFFKAYVQDIGQRAMTALTGKKYERVIGGGSELVETLGVENKIAKFGLGFAADVLLDPSTYFGGSAIRYGVKGVKKIVGGGINIAEKVAPKTIGALKVVGEGAKDALGKAFVRGYKSSPGLEARVTDTLAEINNTRKAIYGKAEFRTGILSESQKVSAGKALIAKRKEIFKAEQDTANTLIETYNKSFNANIKDVSTVKRILPKLEQRAARETSRIQKAINYLQRDITKAETSDLQALIKELRLELGPQSRKVVSGVATEPREVEAFLKSTINLQRRELQEIIGALEARLKYGSRVELSALPKAVTETWSQKITRLNKKMLDIQNITVEKQRLLQGILDARKIARAKVDKAPMIIRRDLSKFQRRVVDNLLKSGKPIPQMFRDLAQEGVIQGELSVAKKTGQRLVKEGKLAEETIPEVYFPFIAVDPAKLEKTLRGTQRFGVGGEEYLKEFKNLLKEDDLVQDITKAYGTRRADVIKDVLIEKELRSIVQKFGKQFDNPTQALAEGFVPITRKGISSNIGDVIGYVSKYDAELLGAFTGRAEFATLDLIAKRTGFDAVTSLFKRSVTGLFAPFHVRNWVSGLIQNYEVFGPRALSPKMIANGMRVSRKIAKYSEDLGKGLIKPSKATIRLGGVEYVFDDLVKAIGNRFYGGSFIADISDATQALASQGKLISKASLKKTIKTLGLGQEGIPFRMARKAGEFIETSQKASGVLTALDQGKTLEQALELAKQAGFDYRALTAFESKIMRRIIPFYAFSRFNIALQIKTLLNNPQRVNNIVKVFKNLGEPTSQEEQESLPEYLLNGFGIKVGTDDNGNPQYISSFGTPIEAFFDLLNKNPILKTLSNMNPILKTPIELGIGKDSFRQRDLKEVYNAAEYSKAPQIIKELLQIEAVEKVKYVDGKPTDETYVQYVANPERLLIARGLFTSRGATYLDQVFDGDLQGLAKTLKLTTGLKPVSVDLDYYSYLKVKEQERDLEDVLLRYDAIKEFRTTYEKDKKKKSTGLLIGQ
jgi:hypothetical protein